MKRIINLIVIIVFLYSDFLFAEVNNTYFDALVEETYKNNHIIKSYENYVSASKKDISIANSYFLPKINFDYKFIGTTEPAQAAYIKAEQGKFSMNYYYKNMTDPPFVRDHKFVLSLMQPIFAKGKITLSKKQAALNYEAAEASFNEVKREIKFKLFTLLINGNKLFDNIDIVKTMKRKADTYFKTIRNLYKNGISLKSDLLFAKFHLTEANINLNNALNEVNKINHALEQITGKKCKVRKVNFEINDKIDIDKLIDYGLAHREDIVATKKYLKVAEIELQKNKNEYLPEVYGFANYERNSEKIDEFDKDGYTVGVGVKLNIFNGFQDKNKIDKAKFNLLRLKNLLYDKEETLKREIKDAFIDFQNAKYRYESLKELVKTNKLALQLSENRFKNGLERITVLVDMETNYKVSLKELSSAKWDMVQKYYTILFKSGKF